MLIQFGGHESAASWDEVELPGGWFGLVITPDNSTPALPGNFRTVSKEAYIPDLVEAADVVFGKLGYGTCSEAISSNRPLVFVHRTHFNEQAGLLRLMQESGCAVELSVENFRRGKWAEAILEADRLAAARQNKAGEISPVGGPQEAAVTSGATRRSGDLSNASVLSDGGRVAVAKLLEILSGLPSQ